MQEFYSNGKLLLSGEYVILDGALGLAIPTKYGQSLCVSKHDHDCITWKSMAVDQSFWFEAELQIENLEISYTTELETAKTLQKILRQAKKSNNAFLKGPQGYIVASYLNFDRSWGLGSSSTLINNIAQWAQVDPYELLWNAFSGSGYDIACAQHNSALLYYLKDDKPVVEALTFNPIFKEHLFFIHLNKKQNSRDGIAQYRAQGFDKSSLVKRVSKITKQMLSATNLSQFEALLDAHEHLIAENLNLKTVKSDKFPDYSRSIKSLGAWGGDFVLATGNADTPGYFKEKGYNTVIPFSKMIL